MVFQYDKGGRPGSTKDEIQKSVDLPEGDASQSQAHSLADDNVIPLPPPLGKKDQAYLFLAFYLFPYFIFY